MKTENKEHPNFGERIPVNEIMEMWADATNLDINETVDKIRKFEIIPYDFKGRRFGHDSIRLEGTYDFIYTILAMLNPMKIHVDSSKDKTFEIFMFTLKKNQVVPFDKKNKETFNRYCCYIRLKEKKGILDNGKK